MQTFCRNEYNLTGLCSKPACPLANGNYATVRVKKGKLYLYIKTIERASLPAQWWEEVRLDDNYEKALAQIDEKLPFWNKFQVHKCKQRLTKLTEMLQRMRRLKLRSSERFSVVKQKTERRDAVRLDKAEDRANVERQIEKELLDRLKLGTYGELYEDLLNLNKNAFKEHLKDENAVDSEIEDFELDDVDFDDVDIDNDFEYVFSKKNKDDNLLDFDDLEEDDSDQEGGPEYKEDAAPADRKRKIKKKRMELAMDDDKDVPDSIAN